MKIAFDCHVPFALAHGGVQIQVEQTQAALARKGLDVHPLHWWDDTAVPDLIHFFGKPSVAYARLVRQKKIRLVVADLLTSQGSRTAWQRFPFRLLCLLDRVFRGKLRQKLGWTVYDLADCCVCLTPWEAALIQKMYGAKKARIAVVPNGVEDIFRQSHSTLPRGGHLITTVTITPRKRVVELVYAAALAHVKLRIIGKPYHPDDPYYLLFLRALKDAEPWVTYVGSIEERPKLAEQYQQAAGFVLLSAMESQSLSALEAAACGCPLMLSDLPWARSSFGPEASYAPITSVKKTARYLRCFVDGIENVPRVAKVPSWDDVATKLENVYRDAINSR